MGWDDLNPNKAKQDAPDLKRGKRRQASSDTAGMEETPRLLPHDIANEEAIIGAILLSPDDCLSELADKLPAGADSFFEEKHKVVYRTLQTMFQSREGIDVITLGTRLKEQNLLDNIGGLAWLNAVQDKTAGGSMLASYCEIVLEKYFLRRAILLSENVAARCREAGKESGLVLDGLERDVMVLSMERTKGKKKIRPMSEHIGSNLLSLEQQQAGLITGLMTGFRDLDLMTGGLKPKNFYLVAARPSVGKSSLVMNAAEYVSLELRQAVGVFSLEMDATALSMRCLSANARVNVRHAKDGFSTEEEQKLMTSARNLAKAPIWIDDESGLNILQIRSRARRMVNEFGIKMVIIDYLQLIHPFDKRMLREESVDQTALGCKEMAKELGLPVLVAAQLNRDLEKRGKNARPNMADIRGSGAVEQHADLIGLLYSSADDKERMAETVPVTLIVAKQRNGPTGDIQLSFRRSITRFENVEKIDGEDAPAQTKMPYAEDEPPIREPNE